MPLPQTASRSKADNPPMTFSTDAATAALNALIDDYTGQTLGQSKAIKNLRVDGVTLLLDLVLSYPAASTHDLWRERIKPALATDSAGVEVPSTI